MAKAFFVEDEIICQRGTVAMLKKLRPDWKICAFNNGCEVLAAIERERCDLLLTDIKMPLMGRV